MKSLLLCLLAVLCAAFSGCRAVYNVERAKLDDLQAEGTIVFTRPARFTPLFGSYSISELVEITYEKVSRNAAGQLVVEAGIRFRGPVSWTNWNVPATSRVTLKTRCNFYGEGGVVNSPIIYSTNQREIVIPLGGTYAYKAVCPRAEASRYQIVLGE